MIFRYISIVTLFLSIAHSVQGQEIEVPPMQQLLPEQVQEMLDKLAEIVRQEADDEVREGEVVFDGNGQLDERYFREYRVCTFRGCDSIIYDLRTGERVLFNGGLMPGFIRTENDGEIIRYSGHSPIDTEDGGVHYFVPFDGPRPRLSSK